MLIDFNGPTIWLEPRKSLAWENLISKLIISSKGMIKDKVIIFSILSQETQVLDLQLLQYPLNIFTIKILYPTTLVRVYNQCVFNIPFDCVHVFAISCLDSLVECIWYLNMNMFLFCPRLCFNSSNECLIHLCTLTWICLQLKQFMCCYAKHISLELMP